MELNTYFTHNTDEEIIHSKRLQDLQTWIGHLSYVSNECDWLAKIASNIIHDKILRDELLVKIEINSALLNEFYNYKSSIQSFHECDDLDCDLFYINQHDTFYAKYLNHIADYRQVKSKVYLKILD